MALTYVSQKAAELTYYLYERKLPPEMFKIFRSRRVELEGFAADIWIIGASHVMCIEAGGKAITEVVASMGSISSDDCLVESTGLYEKDMTFARNQNRLRYHTTSKKLFFRDEGDYEEKHNEIEELKNQNLFFSFPASEGSKLAPFTSVTIEGNRPLLVETVHAYPEERVLIYTRSKVGFSNGHT